MSWSEPESCRICGNTDKRDLRVGLVHWLHALPGMQYEQVAKCRDEDACRRRIAQQGDVWPLVESTKGSAA